MNDKDGLFEPESHQHSCFCEANYDLEFEWFKGSLSKGVQGLVGAMQLLQGT